jgi:hypothetical protein
MISIHLYLPPSIIRISVKIEIKTCRIQLRRTFVDPANAAGQIVDHQVVVPKTVPPTVGEVVLL